MWRKLLKYREIAKILERVEVKNGETTSFWYDSWSSKGRLWDICGDRGFINMGISANATVHEPIHGHRRRKHRVSLLNRIEEMIAVQKIKTEQEEDIAVWKYQEDQYKAKFSTKSTWLILREAYIKCGWDKAVWFSYATPKYAFIHWVAMHDRLFTGSRMLQ